MRITTEDLHPVVLLRPQDVDAASGFDTTYCKLSEHGHATCILAFGANGSGGTCDITVESAASSTGSGASAIAFDYAVELSSSQDTPSALSTLTSTGFTSSTGADVMYCIEVDAADLDDGDEWFRIVGTDPGVTAVVQAGITAVLTGGRYRGATSRTALA